jgi:outer membrane protein assembly factor BamB
MTIIGISSSPKRVGIMGLCLGALVLQAMMPFALADDWPMFLQNPNHTGATTSVAPVDPKVLWQKGLNQDGFYASPSVHNGKIFIGGVDRKMYALDEATGDTIWTFSTSPSSSPEGKGIDNTAAVAGGRVYFGSDDFKFYCVDEGTGKVAWSYEVANMDLNPSTQGVQASAVTVGNVVYTGADATEGDKLNIVDNLLAFDAVTGTVKWTFDTNGRVYSSPAVDGNRLFAGTFSGDLYVLDASTGTPLREPTVLWTKHFDHPIVGSPMLIDQRVYLGLGGYSETAGSYYLYSFTYDGTEIWRYKVDFPILSTPIPYNGRIFFADAGGNVYALDKEGKGDGTTKLIWSRHLSDSKIWATTLISDGRLYIPSTDHRIYSLDTDGNGDGTTFEVWNMSLDGEIWSSPVVADDKVLVATTNGTVYCIIEDPSPSQPDEPEVDTVGVEPFDAKAGKDVTVTMTFLPGGNLSKVKEVTVDLSLLGGHSGAALNDHGVDGDRTASDGRFSLLYRIPKTTTEGFYELVVVGVLVSGKKFNETVRFHVGPPDTGGGGGVIPGPGPVLIVMAVIVAAIAGCRRMRKQGTN